MQVAWHLALSGISILPHSPALMELEETSTLSHCLCMTHLSPSEVEAVPCNSEVLILILARTVALALAPSPLSG